MTPRWDADPAIEARVDSLLARMTLREKIGQLNQFAAGHPTGPETGERPYEEMIASGDIGAMLNVPGADEIARLQRIAIERSRMAIPLLFGLDVVHGYRTTFPIPLAMAATWDPTLVEHAAAAAAREAAADGVRWTFAPMVDIARDARWGRILEGAGEDPFLGGELAAAYVRGYQGERLSDATSVAACVKHFVGYGAAEAGRDYNSTYVPERLLREIYLRPFEAAIRAGAATLMTAFSTLNDVPVTASAFLVQQLLKREWQFAGFVVSDWGAIKELITHGVATDYATAARKAFLAGVDMDMESGLYVTELAALVDAGSVSIAAIDESVRRVLGIKLALGLFERPYAAPHEPNADDEAIALARRAATASFVLLKNAPALLPLGPDVRRVALVGALADDAASMLGAWAADGEPDEVVTLRAALQDTTFAVEYEPGNGDAGITAAVAAARRADVVVLAVGESAELSGEAASRTRLDLPGEQARLVDAIASAGTPVVMVVFGGRPLALAPYVDNAAAIVQAWLPGAQAGPALVDVLTGAANASGRLPVSLPRSVGQLPLYYNLLATGRPLDAPGAEHDRWRSRYLDEQTTPLFPFGHGLSYTRFAYSSVTLDASAMRAEDIRAGARVTARATITNVGDRDGVEVAQLYIRRRGTSVALPIRELKGFRRVALARGEAREVEIELGASELAFYSAELTSVVEPAIVTVWIAPDAQSGTGVELVLT